MENNNQSMSVTEQELTTMMTHPDFFKNVLPLKEDEYFDEIDQNIKCKKCNTRRTRGGLENNGPRVRFLCKCQAMKVEERDSLLNTENTNRRIQILKEKSMLNNLYKNVSFETSDYNRDASFVKASNFCMKYCDYPLDAIKQNYGLYIYGDTGSGKTHLMACMINKLTNQMFSCLMTNFSEIQRNIANTFYNKNSSENEYIDDLLSVDFLFIDDFGVEKLIKQGDDTWLQQKIYDIINTRYNQNKPVIFSSNYSLNELKSFRSVELRTIDRISAIAKKDIKVTGTSYRQIQNRKAKLPFEV